MATSSITKEFVVKDIEAYKELLKKTSDKPERELKKAEPSEIERGKQLLKQFSFR